MTRMTTFMNVLDRRRSIHSAPRSISHADARGQEVETNAGMV